MPCRLRATLALSCSVLLVSACDRSPTESQADDDVGAAALNSVVVATTSTVTPGDFLLGIEAQRDARLAVPASAVGKCPLPLLVLLHGAGGTPNQITTVLNAAAELGIAVVVPRSREATWEIARQTFGADVSHIDRAIDQAVSRVCVDKERVALAGFSDGASFALSLGVANGRLLTHVIAFAPGFILDPGHRGRPAFFVAHGSGDGVLPFDNTQRLFVPYLQHFGYDVSFEIFQDGHTVPPLVARSALTWFLGR